MAGEAGAGETPRTLTVYTDGGARGNPGPAAIGVVVADARDRPLREHGEFLGDATNNEAEYRALIKGLEIAAGFTRGPVTCVSDSELVTRQMRGEYRVREPRLVPLHEEARVRARAFESVEFRSRPRLTGRLRRADELVNEALDAGARDDR
ncbi:MAG TPA: ribonuclease HI family protein [Thermoplasmata archaeon]|nr:ribonuclease HI family protein [Thermoplasmata archaeon]